ncbi:SLOG family protein [Bradyrhizobium sp. USDA 4350]
MTVVLVCGGRNYGRVKLGTPRDQLRAARLKASKEIFILRETLDLLHRERTISKVVDGAASGADGHAHAWATSKGIATERFKAAWRMQGRAAGPIRNAKMLADGKPDLVVAFTGGDGTANMIRQARAAGVEVMDLREGDE